MFKVANRVSYDGLMVHGTHLAKSEVGKVWLGESCWIDIPSTNSDGPWVSAQGKVAVALVRRIKATEKGLFTEDGIAHVYVITPFRAVAKRIRSDLYAVVKNENKKIAVTVHTFQGREADVVIFLLGGDPKKSVGWATEEANILNVALTRARRRLYVIGDHSMWNNAHFKELAKELQVVEPEEFLQGLKM
jgi:hypothetical protein